MQRGSKNLPEVFKRLLRDQDDDRMEAVDKTQVDSIIGNMLQALIVVNSRGEIATINRSALNLLGYREEELIGESVTKILGEPKRYGNLGMNELMAQGSVDVLETRYRTKSGKKIPVLFSISSILNYDGFILAAQDISKHKRTEEALQLTQYSIDHCADAILWIGREATISYVNESACQVLGYTRDELLSMSIEKIDPYFSRKDWREHWKEVKRVKSLRMESTHRTKEGRIFPVEVSINFVKFHGKEYQFAFARDISERLRAEENLSFLAHHDGLTHLPNRALLIDRLDQALVRAPRFKRTVSVLFLDIDHFKDINDSLGHSAGDLLLQAVAQRLKRCVRKSDTVSRLGGDEFAIVMADITDQKVIPKIIEKIPRVFSDPFQVGLHELFVTASIGVSIYPDDGEDAEALLQNADTAMYRAKEKGRNRCQFFFPRMNVEVSERLAMETSLRRAMDRGEFLLHYQPQVDLSSGEIVGMEALIRWNHPDRGMVPPSNFIPVAEESGLIVPLGEWVLRMACLQNKAWQRAGIEPLRVAVNLSARQFQHQNFVGMVQRALAEAALEPRYLELELTESIMQTAEVAITVLHRLSEIGVEISIDDFGTGYSSLSYLKRFPIQRLKIDQSFVRNIANDSEDTAIVATIITLARSLRLKVIAEGVETRQELAILRSLECQEIQGYLFSRPLPVEEATALLRERKRLDDL